MSGEGHVQAQLVKTSTACVYLGAVSLRLPGNLVTQWASGPGGGAWWQNCTLGTWETLDLTPARNPPKQPSPTASDPTGTVIEDGNLTGCGVTWRIPVKGRVDQVN